MSDAIQVDEEKEQILMSLKKTRKAFLPEYLCGFFLLLLLVFAQVNKVQLPKTLNYLVFGIAVVCFASAEFARSFIRYRITPTKVIVIKGYIKQTKKNVYFHSLAYVPDISTSQTRMQRLLGYGRVYIHGGGMAEMFEIEDINNPQKILKQLEDLVKKTRKPQGQ